jgi:hypothetical protein
VDKANAFKSKIWGWAECFLGKVSWNSKILGLRPTVLMLLRQGSLYTYTKVTGLWAGVAEKLEV